MPDEPIEPAAGLTRNDLNRAFQQIEEISLNPSRIIIPESTYNDIRALGRPEGFSGTVYTPTSPPTFVGEMPIRQDITVLPADNPDHLRLGWVIHEEIGIVIVNDAAVARVSFTDEPSEDDMRIAAQSAEAQVRIEAIGKHVAGIMPACPENMQPEPTRWDEI